MNKTNTNKFSALVDEFGYKLLLVELVYKLDDDTLRDTFNVIADNWDMEFTKDNTELVYINKDENEEDCEDDYTYSDDDEPSWKELMQDRYPTYDDGTVFSTMSGF
jgi:hypothetical protein|nr:MAG TPA: hypothetical protein [Caudoviricetes sp.]